LFQGDRSRPYVKDRVQNADCVLELGVVLTDFNTGGFTMKLDQRKVIRATINTVYISNHNYRNVYLKDFLKGLASKLDKRDPATLDIHPASKGCVHRRTEQYKAQGDQKLCVRRFFDRASHFIPENSIVIAETGQSMFSAAETMLPKKCTFVGQIFYGSIGYTVGATLGCCVAGKNRPVVLFVGDGSFQMTAQDISTMIRYKQKPIIFLLNNDGYLIERTVTDGYYNDIQPWKYHKLPEAFGSTAPSYDVWTEDQLENALKQAEKQMKTDLTFIEIHTDRMDASEPMKEAGKAMAKKNYITPHPH
jgi:indolepyruvate decarboxylase